jgi:hypothetical protein
MALYCADCRLRQVSKISPVCWVSLGWMALWWMFVRHLKVQLKVQNCLGVWKKNNLAWKKCIALSWSINNTSYDYLTMKTTIGDTLNTDRNHRSSSLIRVMYTSFIITHTLACTINILQSSYDNRNEWRLYFKWVKALALPLALP